MKKMRTLAKKFTLTLTLVTVFLIPAIGYACGGFFCSNFPIDQAGEKILFHADGDKVTAVIQIQFTGDAEDFSWVLPLPNAPDNSDEAIRVGSEELFVQLMARTSPSFVIEWDPNSPCQGMMMYEDIALSAAPEFAEAGSDKSVEVLQVKEVGPYDTAVVKSDDPEALSAWLNENGYDQPEESADLIKYYVEQDNVFLALKLQQNKQAGDIAPIIVEFNEPQGPCIPLVLTAIAATPDMPVYSWVIDEQRIVPKNFFHVGINQAKIDWLNNGDNYVEVVTEAVNEAAGHGFVTDYAGPSDIMKESLVWEGRFGSIDSLMEIASPRDFYTAFINSGLPSNTQTLGLLEKYIPVPDYYEGDSMNFYNEIPWNDEHAEYLEQLEFDPVAAVEEIKKVVIKPMEDAQALLDGGSYLTRLFTTVSEDEMNRDPIFVPAPSLPDVPRERKATATATCGGEYGDTIQSMTLTLEDGTIIEIEGPFEYWDAPVTAEVGTADGMAISEVPAAAEVAFVNDTGALETVEPELVEYYDSVLAFANTEVPPAPGDAQEILPEPVLSSGDGDGCQTGQGHLGLGILALALFALATCRRISTFSS